MTDVNSRENRKRICRAPALLLIGALLVGCSSSFWYNRADWLIGWYVDDYIDFNRDQQRFFDARLEEVLHWHRREQLPRYVDFLSRAEQAFAGEVTVAGLEAFSGEMWNFWRDIVARSLPDMQQLFSGLSPEQKQEFIRALQRQQREFAEEYVELSDVELQRERRKRMRKLLKRWIGSLDTEQRERIAQWATRLPNNYPLISQQQVLWNDRFTDWLLQGGSIDELERLYVYPDDLWSAEYRERMESSRRMTLQMLVDIHRSLGEEQRRKLLGNLARWHQDFEQLQR